MGQKKEKIKSILHLLALMNGWLQSERLGAARGLSQEGSEGESLAFSPRARADFRVGEPTKPLLGRGWWLHPASVSLGTTQHSSSGAVVSGMFLQLIKSTASRTRSVAHRLFRMCHHTYRVWLELTLLYILELCVESLCKYK